MIDWNFACPAGWEEKLRRGESLVPPLPLDKAEAKRAVDIFNKLRLPDVPGQPRMLDAAGEWQRDIVRAIFGSIVDGVRRVPELLVMVPKKSSKTTMGAAITLTAMLMNVRPRAEFIYIGPTQEVADLAFQQTVGMIEADEYLAKRFHLAHHTKTITDRRNKTRLKVKTFDMKVVTGSKPAFILLDELHLMATINGADRVIGQIRGGMLPNPEAALVMITTQSDQKPAGIWKTELEKARLIRDGKGGSNPILLPVLYEFPPDLQKDETYWRDPKNWPPILPNLGKSIDPDRLVEDYENNGKANAEAETIWVSQHLNIEIGVGHKNDGWAGAKYWAQGEDAAITLEELIERCEVIVVSLDGGGLDDLYGVNVLGREKGSRDWLSWSHAWCHEGVLDRRQSIASRLLDFQAAGDLTIYDVAGDDIDGIIELISTVKDRGLLGAVAVDPAGLGEMVERLAEIDVTVENKLLVGAPQGFGMMNAIKTAERKLQNGTLRHAKSSLMDWCVGNVKIEPMATAIRATKQNAGDAKIDPWAALMNGVWMMSRNPEAQVQLDIAAMVA